MPHIADQAALVIAPEGEIVEQLSGDPARAAIAARRRARAQPETLLWDLIDAIRGAAEGQAHPGAGPRPREIRRRRPADARGARRAPSTSSALRARRSWPSARAHRRSATTSPRRPTRSISIRSASCCIDGYDRYRMFFKEALDKLGVDVNVFRVGAYKSAVEVTPAPTCRPRTRRRASRT